MFGTKCCFRGWRIVWIYFWLNQIQEVASRQRLENFKCLSLEYVI